MQIILFVYFFKYNKFSQLTGDLSMERFIFSFVHIYKIPQNEYSIINYRDNKNSPPKVRLQGSLNLNASAFKALRFFFPVVEIMF